MHSCADVASRTVTNKSEHLRVNLHRLLKIMDVYKYGLSWRKSKSPWQLFNFFFLKDTVNMRNVESNLAFNPEQLYEALTGPG